MKTECVARILEMLDHAESFGETLEKCSKRIGEVQAKM